MNSMELAKIVTSIAGLRGLNAKMNALAQAEGLKNIVRTTYSPYVHFNIKPTAAWIEGCGNAQFDATTTELLHQLASGQLRGGQAKASLVAELARLDPYSADLLVKIINKDLRWGMQAASINKVWPDLVPVFPVQLAKTYEQGRMKFPCLASPKLDGLRCVYTDGVLRSRNGNRLRGLEHIEEYIKTTWPNVRRLDGELMVPGMTFNALSGDIRAFRKSDNAVYHVFDLFIQSPTVAPFYARYAQLMSMLLICGGSGMIKPVEHTIIYSEDEANEFYERCRDQGYEGAILKNDDAYEVIGRTWDWCKMKPKDTADCVVTGIVRGTGKYQCMVGALVVDYKGKECRVGGGMTDEQRQAWDEDPNLIVGKTVEVDYMEETEYGAMRHPRLKVVRGDK